MITKTIIRDKTNSTSYSRGMAIYKSNKIMEFAINNEGNNDYIEAIVKGSGRNIYKVSAICDTDHDDLNDIYCECPAYSSYYGICKHCVSVLLEYIDRKKQEEEIKKHDAKREAALEQLKTMKGIKSNKMAMNLSQMQTTPVIKQLLSHQTMKRTLPLLQGSQYGNVHIEPLLKCSYENILLEFKIGVTHRYILKDVFEFVDALDSYKNVNYGKKLQFVHTMEAFAPECRPLVQFIRNWVYRNKNQYIQNTYYGYAYDYKPPKLRVIPLETDELEELLDALEGNKVMATVNDSVENEWQLTNEELPREMVIRGMNDGIQVKINCLFGYEGNHSLIYFYDEKIYRLEKSKNEPIIDFINCMAAIPNRTVFIQKDDIPLFCRELLPDLEQHFKCQKENFDENDYGLHPVSFEIYLDAPQKDFITCKVMAVYGDNEFNVYSNIDHETFRDQVREIEVGKVVASFCNAYDEQEKVMVVGDDEDKIYELLVYGIPRMQEIAEVYISDALKRMKIIAAPKVAVGISITSDLLELKMTADDMSKEQLLEILTKYNRKKKFYRLKNGDFVNVSGDNIEALIELKKGLNLTEKQLKQNTIEIPRYRALYLDAELKERNSIPVMKDKGFKSLIRNMKTVEDNDFDIPDSLENILREYQKRGYLWLKTLKYNGFGGILADDMGLGKTLQVICFLWMEYLESGAKDKRRTLIVSPSSLVFNWNNEFIKFASQLPVKMVIGTSLERQQIIQNIGTKDILITSYDLLKRDIQHYEKIAFQYEIIDEAQYIKNSNTQAAQSVKRIKAGFKLALTGTPIENRLSELWSIFDYIMPGFLYSYKKFREELEMPIIQKQDEVAVRQLQKMITPFVLRRLKKDVLTDLPDKMEESIYASMEGEQQKLYDAHVKKLQILLGKQSDDEFKNSKIQILSELTKLRQICCDPTLLYDDYHSESAKTEICMDLIQNAISGGHKILLFSQFTSMLEKLQIILQKENIPYYSLTGATSKVNRAKMVDRFNKDDVPIFCISLKAGGTGLNLTSADIVIHFDPWWNIAVQNQATDRAHRIGQKNVVSVYKLIVKGTIEENIIKMQEKKKELAEQVLSGKGINVGSFTREELLELLQ